jgi:hypothetical protein
MIKKILNYTFSALTIITLSFGGFVLPQSQKVFAEGEIEISTCLELQLIGNDEAYPLDGDYVLADNINCGEGAPEGNDTRFWNPNADEWTGGLEEGAPVGDLIADELDGVVNNGYFGFEPIATGQNFTGTFDGAGFKISNIWIFRKSADNVGIFASFNGGSVSNLSIENAKIVGANNTGILAGRMQNVLISDVGISESMVRAYLSNNGGGITGNVSGATFSNIEITNTDVHGSGNIMGGIAGFVNDSEINNADVNVNVDGGYRIGGAFGELSNSTISGVDVTGTVLGEDNEANNKFSSGVGGFAGMIDNSNIDDSSFSGTVTVNKSVSFGAGYDVGGFAGYIEGVTITNSFASSEGDLIDINTDNNNINFYNVGGFVGFISEFFDEEEEIITRSVMRILILRGL